MASYLKIQREIFESDWINLPKSLKLENRIVFIATPYHRDIHFAKFYDETKLMSVKKQLPSFCKFCSFYEEIPEEFLDKTDIDSYFYHNISDIPQSQRRIVRVSRGSNNKSFAIKLFQFCDLKTQQRYIL